MKKTIYSEAYRQLVDRLRERREGLGHTQTEIRGKYLFLQVLCSAAANATNNYGFEKKKLIITETYANEGPKLKRIRPRAQGRAYKILKPTCHITVVVKSI